MAAVTVVLVLAVLFVAARAYLRRPYRGGSAYADVPAVGRTPAEERRAHQGGLASLEDMSGAAGPISADYWAAKKFDEDTRRSSD